MSSLLVVFRGSAAEIGTAGASARSHPAEATRVLQRDHGMIRKAETGG